VFVLYRKPFDLAGKRLVFRREIHKLLVGHGVMCRPCSPQHLLRLCAVGRCVRHQPCSGHQGASIGRRQPSATGRLRYGRQGTTMLPLRGARRPWRATHAAAAQRAIAGAAHAAARTLCTVSSNSAMRTGLVSTGASAP
jgi:hypothetical protein